MVQKYRALARGVALSRARRSASWRLALLLGGCPPPWTRPDAASVRPRRPQPAEPAPAPPAPGGARAAADGHRSRRARITSRPPPARWSRRRTRCSRTATSTAHPSTLDRALRIEPNNPLLWIELGRVRLVESDAHQAEVCARKALALASGDRAAQGQAGQCSPMRCAPRDATRKRAGREPAVHALTDAMKRRRLADEQRPGLGDPKREVSLGRDLLDRIHALAKIASGAAPRPLSG